MGSKRTKKSKQEVEVLAESDVKKNEENILEPAISNVPTENNSEKPAVPKAPKRKKKSDGADEVPKKVKKRNESESKKVTVKKKKIKSDIISKENEENKQLPVNKENGEQIDGTAPKSNKSDSADKKKDEISWPDQDIVELINRMESNIPEKDALAYRSRVEKLNWDSVSFKTYSGEACKQTWCLVQKRIRGFRLLREVLNDAKEWISAPRINHKLPKPKKHPDMPRRPLSSYLLFYLKKKDEVISENPGLDASDLTKIMGQIYKNLPPEKREKYEKMAATNREEYMTKLKIFFENHPEVVPPPRLNLNHRLEKEKPVKVDKVEKVQTKIEKEKTPKSSKDKPKNERRGRPPRQPTVERPPKKFQTPFGLYLASEAKNEEPGKDKAAFREKCKEQYKAMPDKKKVHWINLAEQDLIRYQEEVKAYKAKYPEYKVQKVKSILTKREKASKERAAGKPVKPPNSAYALYSRVMLQSDEIKSVHPKDRMNYIASKWKTCTEEEQNTYRDQVIHLMEQYKQEYEAYVSTLPEEEKNKILQASKRKRGKGGHSSTSSRNQRPRKRKSVRKAPPVKSKFVEPEQPPISACKYFATVYQGEGDAVQAWKALNVEEKRKFEDELVKKKQAYIVEFERFLKSLSKEELEAFSKSRQQQVQSDDEDSSECSSGSEDDGDDDEDDGEGDGEERNEQNGEVHNNEDNGRDSDSE